MYVKGLFKHKVNVVGSARRRKKTYTTWKIVMINLHSFVTHDKYL